MIRGDFHIHTHYSRDCINSPQKLVARCLKAGLNCVAITDHNTIRGALEVQKIAPFKVIIGEEIATPLGEIIGLFLKEEVPRGLPPIETVRRIKAQGGVVCIPHPFDRVRRSPLKHHALMAILPQVDVVEVFNARTTFQSDLDRCRRFAEEHHLHGIASSDAHTPWELGNARTEMPDFNGPEEFKIALAQARAWGRRTPFFIHFVSRWAKLSRRFFQSTP